jgi:hypothetical protein
MGMKTLTVELSEDVYERAERRATSQGATLSQQVVHLVREYGAQTDTAQNGDVAALFATLDRARNVTPIGSLRREQLYDRDVLR